MREVDPALRTCVASASGAAHSGGPIRFSDAAAGTARLASSLRNVRVRCKRRQMMVDLDRKTRPRRSRVRDSVRAEAGKDRHVRRASGHRPAPAPGPPELARVSCPQDAAQRPTEQKSPRRARFFFAGPGAARRCDTGPQIASPSHVLWQLDIRTRRSKGQSTSMRAPKRQCLCSMRHQYSARAARSKCRRCDYIAAPHPSAAVPVHAMSASSPALK